MRMYLVVLIVFEPPTLVDIPEKEPGQVHALVVGHGTSARLHLPFSYMQLAIRNRR